jgi:hypothetical protein
MDTTHFFIPIDSIRVSPKQARKVCQKKVSLHLATIEAGDEPMPIDVRQLQDGSYVIDGNGRHRYFAYLAAGYATIPVTLTRWYRDVRRIIGRWLRLLAG